MQPFLGVDRSVAVLEVEEGRMPGELNGEEALWYGPLLLLLSYVQFAVRVVLRHSAVSCRGSCSHTATSLCSCTELISRPAATDYEHIEQSFLIAENERLSSAPSPILTA